MVARSTPGSGALLPTILTKARQFPVSDAIFHFTVPMHPDHKYPWLRKHCWNFCPLGRVWRLAWFHLVHGYHWLSLWIEALQLCRQIPSCGAGPEPSALVTQLISTSQGRESKVLSNPQVTRVFKIFHSFLCFSSSHLPFPISLLTLLPIFLLLKLPMKWYLSICPMF